MAKPVISTVGDDPQVLRADSGESALDTLGMLRGDRVELFLVGQRIPGMSGVAFLEEAIGRFPDAKRARLTAYLDESVEERG